MSEEIESLLEKDIPGLVIEKVHSFCFLAYIIQKEISKRLLTVAFKRPKNTDPILRISMSFPTAYPHAAPSFTVLFNATGEPDYAVKEGMVFTPYNIHRFRNRLTRRRSNSCTKELC